MGVNVAQRRRSTGDSGFFRSCNFPYSCEVTDHVAFRHVPRPYLPTLCPLPLFPPSILSLPPPPFSPRLDRLETRFRLSRPPSAHSHPDFPTLFSPPCRHYASPSRDLFCPPSPARRRFDLAFPECAPFRPYFLLRLSSQTPFPLQPLHPCNSCRPFPALAQIRTLSPSRKTSETRSASDPLRRTTRLDYRPTTRFFFGRGFSLVQLPCTRSRRQSDPFDV